MFLWFNHNVGLSDTCLLIDDGMGPFNTNHSLHPAREAEADSLI